MLTVGVLGVNLMGQGEGNILNYIKVETNMEASEKIYLQFRIP